MPESSFSQRVIAAHKAGVAERRAGEERAEQQEDRKLQQKLLKHQIERLTIQDLLEERNAAMQGRQASIQLAQLMNLQPGPERQVGGPPGTMTAPGEGNLPFEGVGQMPIPGSFTQDLPLDAVSIPGIPAAGGAPEIPASSYQPTSMQEHLRRTTEAARAASMLKREEGAAEGFTLPEGASRIIPGATGGRPASIFTNPKEPTYQPETISVDGKGPVAALRTPQGQYVFASNLQPITGEISPYERPFRPSAFAGSLSPGTATRVGIIAQQFDSSPIVKSYTETQNRLGTTEQILSGVRTGPGDLAQVFEFMKGLDPQSVVRETEYATAAKSGNIFAGWAAKFNGYLKPEGGFLPENVRQEFMKLLGQKLAASQKQVDNLRDEQARKIDKWTGGTDGEDYLTDFTGGRLNPPPSPARPTTADEYLRLIK